MTSQGGGSDNLLNFGWVFNMHQDAQVINAPRMVAGSVIQVDQVISRGMAGVNSFLLQGSEIAIAHNGKISASDKQANSLAVFVDLTSLLNGFSESVDVDFTDRSVKSVDVAFADRSGEVDGFDYIFGNRTPSSSSLLPWVYKRGFSAKVVDFFVEWYGALLFLWRTRNI